MYLSNYLDKTIDACFYTRLRKFNENVRWHYEKNLSTQQHEKGSNSRFQGQNANKRRY